MNQRFLMGMLLALIIVIVDQLTKFYVSQVLVYGDQVPVFSLLSWMLVHNDGAAFSFLGDQSGWQRWLLAGLAAAFSVYLWYEMRRASSVWLVCALALVLGGAIGNLVDRLTLGYVVDFVLVHWRGHFFPAFNVADAAISIGAAAWIGDMLLNGRSETHRGFA